jgi:hypothetical protein
MPFLSASQIPANDLIARVRPRAALQLRPQGAQLAVPPGSAR